jgi:uncharacterized protein involved in tolerance to divalent cations
MTTVSGKEQAEKIARAVMEARLAACVQIQEIIQLPVEAGFEKYLGWIQRETSQSGP